MTIAAVAAGFPALRERVPGQAARAVTFPIRQPRPLVGIEWPTEPIALPAVRGAAMRGGRVHLRIDWTDEDGRRGLARNENHKRVVFGLALLRL